MDAALKKDDAPVLLSVNNIEVVYDHVILVLKGVSLEVPEGGIVALLGANGAGKTTTLKSISNLLVAERGDITKGTIEFKGESIQGRSANQLVKRGIIQVMEGRRCFEHLTVEENLLTGAFTRSDGASAIRQDLELVYSYFPRLKERRNSTSGYTSGGEQQMTALGRALMAKPKMILLDEPSMGLAPTLVEEIFEIMQSAPPALSMAIPGSPSGGAGGGRATPGASAARQGTPQHSRECVRPPLSLIHI